MPPERRDPVGHTSPTLTRRSAVTGALAASALLAAPRSASAQEATPVSGEVSWLFVQACEGGSATPSSDSEGSYHLTLHHASGQTLFFADRPGRLAGIIPTADFLDDLASVTSDPPNAALAFSPEGPGDDVAVAVVELMTPSAGAGTDVISYQARLIDVVREPDGNAAEGESIVPATELPMSFGQATLFIDSLVEPGQPYIIFDPEG